MTYTIPQRETVAGDAAAKSSGSNILQESKCCHSNTVAQGLVQLKSMCKSKRLIFLSLLHGDRGA
jgi:hypothetical protein